MLPDRAQLGTADAGEGLTGRAANHHVDGHLHRPQAKLVAQPCRRQARDVARAAVGRGAGPEVASEGGCGVRVNLNPCKDLEAGPMQTERQAAATRE
jgi:hypothetical protein